MPLLPSALSIAIRKAEIISVELTAMGRPRGDRYRPVNRCTPSFNLPTDVCALMYAATIVKKTTQKRVEIMAVQKWFTSAAIAGFVMSAPAVAQEVTAGTANEQLTDIIVTAQRRAQNLQDAPLSVTALSAEALGERSVVTIRDVALNVPNTNATPGFLGNPGDATFYIRGIGQEDPSATRDAGVGIYLDGVYLGRSQGAALDTLDVERIEVLRGPQGTLYGRNTIGGAVNVITLAPDQQFRLRAFVGAGSRSRLEGKAYLNLPILKDRVAMSIALSGRTQDGWGRSTTTGQRLGDVRSVSGRTKLGWTPTDNLSVTLVGDFIDFNGTGAPNILRSFNPGITPVGIPLPSPVALAPQICAEFCRDSAQGADVSNRSRSRGVAGIIEWSAADLTIKSITGNRWLTQRDAFDTDASSFTTYDQQGFIDAEQFSQELNVSGKAFDRIDFLLGGYYFLENVDQRRPTNLGSFVDVANPATVSAPFVRFLLNSKTRVESYALFSQVTVRFTDKLSFTGGLRYTHEDKSIVRGSQIDNRAGGLGTSVIPPLAATPPLLLPIASAPQSITYQPMTWRAGLEWKATPDIMVYGSAARGFRSGGYNAQSTNPTEDVAFLPETTTSYEFGVKTELFDRALRLNFAGFYTNYNEIQFLTFQGNFSIIANAAQATIKGLELEFSTREFAGFSFDGSVGYLDARYSATGPFLAAPSPTNPTPRRLSTGDPLPFASEWSTVVGAQYKVALEASGTVRARVDLRYRSAYGFFGNALIADRQPGYALVNMRLTWTDAKERLSVAAYGTNVFNQKYWLFGADQRNGFGVRTGVPAPGAEFGVEANFRF
jgi:iron complex outermembrane recepter protein